MQSNLLKPLSYNIQASVTKTSTFQTAAIEIPLADSYEFILDVTALSGGASGDQTLDVSIQTAMDYKNAANAAPATWYTLPARFAQVNAATGVSQQMLSVQPSLGRGEQASVEPLAATGGQLAQNVPLTKKIRLVFTIGGTAPSFTFAVWLVATPKCAGAY
jgi:hypothetical protein